VNKKECQAAASFPAKERWKWKQNIIILILDDEIKSSKQGSRGPTGPATERGLWEA
jgi:hypothetical protein